jgi:hypothetical protein
MEDGTHPSDLWSGALIAIGLVILQGFFSLSPLDSAALVSVVAFAAAIPILSCNILTNFLRRRQRHKRAESTWEILFYVIGILAALVGIGAALWHTSVISAYVFVGSSFVAMIVFIAVRKNMS